MLYNGKWPPSQQETIFRLPNNIDTFRNARSTRARLLMFLPPGGFENFLEQIGPLSPATDMARMIKIAADTESRFTSAIQVFTAVPQNRR